MTISQATQNKGRSASFVAFWGSKSGIPFNSQRQPLTFCTYRFNGINMSQLSINSKLSESKTNAALHSVRTETCQDIRHQPDQPSPLLYVQKMPRAPGSAGDLDPVQTQPASLSSIASHFCTYRTPAIHEYSASNSMGEISAPFLPTLHLFITPRTTPAVVDGSTSVRTEAAPVDVRATIGSQCCANPNCRQNDAEMSVRPGLVFTWSTSNWSPWTRADAICKSNFQITTIAAGIGACSSPQRSVEWRSVRIQRSAVLAVPSERATGFRAASAPSLSSPLYVQNSRRPIKASVHTERHYQPVDWSLASVSLPLYVQIMRRHSQGSVRTERSGSLNTNAHWQGNLHSTVGIVISDTHRARFPLQRIHRLTRSKTRIAKQNPAMSGVLCIWGTWNWRLKMT